MMQLPTYRPVHLQTCHPSCAASQITQSVVMDVHKIFEQTQSAEAAKDFLMYMASGAITGVMTTCGIQEALDMLASLTQAISDMAPANSGLSATPTVH